MVQMAQEEEWRARAYPFLALYISLGYVFGFALIIGGMIVSAVFAHGTGHRTTAVGIFLGGTCASLFVGLGIMAASDLLRFFIATRATTHGVNNDHS
jgi:hypothetical protein